MIWHTFFQPFIEFGFMRRALVVCLALSLSTTMLGVFLLLRRMSLMGDALSHAILPGVAVGYLLSGMSLLAMTLGGFIAGIVVALVAGWVSRRTPLKEDASFAGFYLGSLALGGVLGYLALLCKQELILAVVGGLFVAETLSVIMQVSYFRWTGGKRLFRMAPLHHHFELKGVPESKIIIRFWITSILLGLVALSVLKLR